MKKRILSLGAICVITVSVAFADFLPFTDTIEVDGRSVKIRDGLDLSNRNLRNIKINRATTLAEASVGYGTLKNMKFDGSDLTGADLTETVFESCSFVGTLWCDTDIFYFDSINDITDAFFIGGKSHQSISFSKELLKTTRNYKIKRFEKVSFVHDLSGMNFRNFEFRDCDFGNCKLADSDFTDARIAGSSFGTHVAFFGVLPKDIPEERREEKFPSELHIFKVSIEQLLVTKDFKEGFVNRVRLGRPYWPPGKVIDLSKKIFVDCFFGYSNKTARIDLTDSVISGCDFEYFHGLTLENVKSTWNYKIGSMEGIKFPEAIQKALDAEKTSPTKP